MNILIWIGLGLAGGWVGCSVLAYSITLGYFQQKYWNVRQAETDIAFSAFVSLFGPISLLVALATSEGVKYGLQWRATSSANLPPDYFYEAYLKRKEDG